MWTDEMTEAIRPLIAGQVVWDLGAGTLGHSFRLLDLGASGVVAIDKGQFNPALVRGQPIHLLDRTPFHTVTVPAPGIKVALLAYPANYNLPGLLRILKRCEVIIYFGSNVAGSACGWPAMWNYLHFREIVGHVPHRRNSLIIYGRHLETRERRPLVGEELGAVSGMGLTFEDAERVANRASAIVKPG